MFLFGNNLDNSTFKEYYSKRMQLTHHKVDVFRAICNFEEQSNLKDGDSVNRPYRSKMVGQTYSRGTAFTVRDISKTNEKLEVNTAKVAPFYVDDLDALQSQHKDMNDFADDSVIVLGNIIDGDVLGEYDVAASSVSEADITSGGSSANGISLDTGNVQSIFAKAKMKLKRKNALGGNTVPKVPGGALRGTKNLFAVISPDFEAVLLEYLAGKETVLGDETGMSGHMGKYYGFDLYVSNSLGWSGYLAMASVPTAGDTVVIQVPLKETVTFTFRDTGDVDTAGEVYYGLSANAARVNLAALINSPSTTSAGVYVALSSTLGTSGFSPIDSLQGIVATNDTSAGIAIKAEGVSFLIVSETLTAAADIWTLAKQIQHSLFGIKGAIEVIIQKEPNVEVKDVPDKIGKNIVPWTLYGLKTFKEGTVQLVDVKIRTDAYSN
jgi:hypothetical protein